MKVGASNQEKAQLGAFSVIVKTDGSFAALQSHYYHIHNSHHNVRLGGAGQLRGRGAAGLHRRGAGAAAAGPGHQGGGAGRGHGGLRGQGQRAPLQ